MTAETNLSKSVIRSFLISRDRVTHIVTITGVLTKQTIRIVLQRSHRHLEAQQAANEPMLQIGKK